MGLRDKLDEWYVRLFGNRATALGLVTGTLSTYLYSRSLNEGNEAMNLASSILGLISGPLIGQSLFGINTMRFYKKTRDHIRENGKLDERFLRKIIESENGRCHGYCETQGAYLAAKQHGQLETFKRVKKEYSKNLLPNF